MIACAIFSIGEEVLEGSIIDTNSNYLTKNLTALGFSVAQIRVLPDNIDEIVSNLKEVSDRYDLIITTGGLGPTFDDLTIQALSALTEKKLYLDIQSFEKIKAILKRRNKNIEDGHRKQALFPEGGIIFDNLTGIANGLGIYYKKAFIVSLPGVPEEMVHIFENELLPFLKKTFMTNHFYMKDLHFSNISESCINEVILNARITSCLKVIINVSKAIVTVRLRGKNKLKIEKACNYLTKKFKDYYFGADHQTLEEVVVSKFKEKGLTLSVAESCTAGMLASIITNVSGSSDIFKGGVVVYSDEAKQKLLNIDKDLLTQKGAVSSEVAFEMAKNVRELFKTDIAVSITGIAGPGGGSLEKPVGLVYIGISSHNKTDVYKNIFNGSRNTVRMWTVTASLTKLYNL
jgi:nicotinamide-nucleotide amidase